MSRLKRQTQKHYKVFCEGDTEYNYIDEMKRQRKLKITIKPVNMEGGGYKEFLNQIRRDGEANCLAKFIIIDGDRAIKEGEGERKNLAKLLEYCDIQNKSERIPHIIIVNCPDFEYVCCLHVKRYRNQQTKQFIIGELSYSSLEAFKKDIKIFKKLTTQGNSPDYMIDILKKRPQFIRNTIKVLKNTFDIRVVNTVCNWELLGAKTSNFFEYYDLLDMFG